MIYKYTLYCLYKYLLTCLDSHMNLSDIPFLIHRVYYDVGSPFAAVTASTLLGRFFHNLFVRSHTDVGQEGLALSLRSNSSQRCSIAAVPNLLCTTDRFHIKHFQKIISLSIRKGSTLVPSIGQLPLDLFLFSLQSSSPKMFVLYSF